MSAAVVPGASAAASSAAAGAGAGAAAARRRSSGRRNGGARAPGVAVHDPGPPPTPTAGTLPTAAAADGPEAENSEDETTPGGLEVFVPLAREPDDAAAAAREREREKLFERAMRKSHGYFIRRVKADGACLFRAASDQIYGDEDNHAAVRREVIDHLVRLLRALWAGCRGTV